MKRQLWWWRTRLRLSRTWSGKVGRSSRQHNAGGGSSGPHQGHGVQRQHQRRRQRLASAEGRAAAPARGSERPAEDENARWEGEHRARAQTGGQGPAPGSGMHWLDHGPAEALATQVLLQQLREQFFLAFCSPSSLVMSKVKRALHWMRHLLSFR